MPRDQKRGKMNLKEFFLSFCALCRKAGMQGGRQRMQQKRQERKKKYCKIIHRIIVHRQDPEQWMNLGAH
jgi:hypothetical protein